MTIPTVTLNDGSAMPSLGLGTYKLADSQMPAAVEAAIAAGYRSFDTASMYGNEASLGRALRACGLPRGELFVTTKLWNSDHGFDQALRAAEASLKRLGLDHVDLYLIHWPSPAQDLYLETWRAFERLRREGRAKAIGVSNFTAAHLTRLLDETGVVPAVNQIELHPGLQQTELRAFHGEHGIVTQAWSPIARGAFPQPLLDLATRLGRTPAQVVLRWHVQSGVVPIPKSSRPERIRENADVFGFALNPSDMNIIAGLDGGSRIGPDPNTF